MIKKYGFYICLIVIYLLFLSKDWIFKFVNNDEAIYNIEFSYLEEYKDLSELVGMENNYIDYLYAKVINRDIYEFYKEFTIARGSNDGIKEGNIVINEKGAVGVIGSVYKNYSVVNLLTNNKVNLSVKINNSYGILNAVDDKVMVKNIKEDEEIKIGDLVYTSGLTSVPNNIEVGEVVNVKRDELDLEYIVEIKLKANLNDINHLVVIL